MAFCLHLPYTVSPPAADALYCYTCEWEQSNWSCLKAQKCSDTDEYCVTNVASVGIGMCYEGILSRGRRNGMWGFAWVFMVALCGWMG